MCQNCLVYFLQAREGRPLRQRAPATAAARSASLERTPAKRAVGLGIDAHAGLLEANGNGHAAEGTEGARC